MRRGAPRTASAQPRTAGPSGSGRAAMDCSLPTVGTVGAGSYGSCTAGGTRLHTCACWTWPGQGARAQAERLARPRSSPAMRSGRRTQGSVRRTVDRSCCRPGASGHCWCSESAGAVSSAANGLSTGQSAQVRAQHSTGQRRSRQWSAAGAAARCPTDFDPEEAAAAVGRLGERCQPEAVYAAHFGELELGAAAAQTKRALEHYQSVAVQAFCLHLEG